MSLGDELRNLFVSRVEVGVAIVKRILHARWTLFMMNLLDVVKGGSPLKQ